jgi:23S rRNA (uridine2552-2'-O)-methyltransferase
MRVLDLGAAPGSWALYAAQRIGPSGKLLAVDLEPLRVALPPQAVAITGDALALSIEDLAGHTRLRAPDSRLRAGDVAPCQRHLRPEARSLEPEASQAPMEHLLRAFAPYDVVLSDMAPSTTGNRFTDQTRSFELFMRALAVAATLGAPGSSFVGKIFMGEDLPLARAELRKHYEKERLIRPEGTRAVSYELFVVGLRKRASA